MLLRSVLIENFRGFKRIEVELDSTTIIIGENNTGKSAFLQALRYALERVKSLKSVAFDDYDFHLEDAGTEPSTADQIKISLCFFETAQDEWPEELTRALADIINLRDDDLQEIRLTIVCNYDETVKDFVQGWSFLDKNGNPLPSKSQRPQVLATLQQIRPIFYLSALRDAGKEFSARSSFWSPFLKSASISPELKEELEAELTTINERIVEAHDSFEHVRTHLAKLQKVIALGAGNIVSIDAVPARIFDILNKAQVNLLTRSGAKLPITRHGEGTQSLSVLMLFDAFLRSRLEIAYDRLSKPIVALEEPEAHLHPSAIRALWQTIDGLMGQKIVSTHSGDLISEVPLLSLRRFCRQNGEITVKRLNATTLTDEELRKFNYHVRRARGELLFAQCWLLGEGETELTVFQESARVLGLDLERYGVRCVEYRASDIEYFIKVANDLGIQWHCLVDNDQQGGFDKAKAERNLNGKTEAERISVLPVDNMDVYLCESGFGSLYEPYLSPQLQPRVTVPKGDPQYWNQLYKAIKNSYSKPKVALDAVEMMRQQGLGSVPPVIKSTLEKALSLAGWRP